MIRVISVLFCLLLLTICLGAHSDSYVNRLLYLNGKGSYLEISNPQNIPDATGEITVEAWIKCSEGEYNPIVSYSKDDNIVWSLGLIKKTEVCKGFSLCQMSSVFTVAISE